MSEPDPLDVVVLLPGLAEDLALDVVRDTHRAVAARSFGLAALWAGPAVGIPRMAHALVAEASYGSVRIGLRGGRAATGLLRRALPRPTSAPDRPVPVGVSRSVLNGLVGDRLVDEGSALAIPMRARRHGTDPEASRLVVFLHGLFETDASWQHRRDEVGSTYPELAESLGWSALTVTYNTGLSVRENGVHLSGLLRDLVAEWPRPVERLVLVGHSMGGLVIRAACAVTTPGEFDGRPAWSRLVTDVVTLGTPHHGSLVAAWPQYGSGLLGRLPETAGFSRILEARSPGVRDLVEGLGEDVVPMDDVRYRLVAATLTRRGHPLGGLVGDLLVGPRSALARGGRSPTPFAEAERVRVGGTDHFGLLNHQLVHARLADWLR